MFWCLGIFSSLAASPTSEAPLVPFALARANVGHMDPGADAPASVLDGSYALTPAEELQEKDKLPVNAYLLTMLVLALAILDTKRAHRGEGLYQLLPPSH